MYRLRWLAEHLNDPDASSDPRITGALLASLTVSVVANGDFWSAAFNLLRGALQWMLSDETITLGMMLSFWLA